MDYANARQTMVDNQIRPADINDIRVIKAFETIPREAFVPKSKRSLAYSEIELETVTGRSLAKPREFAKMLQATKIKASDLVLVIGAGLGYSACIISQLADMVIGLDDTDFVVDAASNKVNDIACESVVMVKGSLESGLAKQGPYDVIFVDGAVERVPQSWLTQLADGGRLVLVRYNKGAGKVAMAIRHGQSIQWIEIFEANRRLLPGFETQKVFEF